MVCRRSTTVSWCIGVVVTILWWSNDGVANIAVIFDASNTNKPGFHELNLGSLVSPLRPGPVVIDPPSSPCDGERKTRWQPVFLGRGDGKWMLEWRQYVEGSGGVGVFDGGGSQQEEAERLPQTAMVALFVGGVRTRERDDKTKGRRVALNHKCVKMGDGLPDAGVWNPWDKKAKAMPDFGDDEYKHMLCVEAAAVEYPITLKLGEEWKGRQQLLVVHSSYCSGKLDPHIVC
ncbi:unnamed protein product [Lactuca saligna]|uniref:Glucose-6-phosphate 1-epimerase n=1 Tax=Lactuca saligna TaxID=75948 RepID=A0AA36EFI4_LACSI|nr:unnamed protein product [Lactuca saligna]